MLVTCTYLKLHKRIYWFRNFFHSCISKDGFISTLHRHLLQLFYWGVTTAWLTSAPWVSFETSDTVFQGVSSSLPFELFQRQHFWHPSMMLSLKVLYEPRSSCITVDNYLGIFPMLICALHNLIWLLNGYIFSMFLSFFFFFIVKRFVWITNLPLPETGSPLSSVLLKYFQGGLASRIIFMVFLILH